MSITNCTPMCQGKTDRPLTDSDRLPMRHVYLRNGYCAERRPPLVVTEHYGFPLPPAERTEHETVAAALEWSESQPRTDWPKIQDVHCHPCKSLVAQLFSRLLEWHRGRVATREERRGKW